MCFRILRLQVILAASCSLVFTAGCDNSSAKQNPIAHLNDSNIKRVANLYAAWQSVHGGQGPTEVTQLEDFARELPNDNLQKMNIDRDHVEFIFVSERDGKPFQIKYGAIRGPAQDHIPIVFEQQGRGGLRQVAFTNARVDEVDDAHYQELWNEKQESPFPMTAIDGASIQTESGTIDNPAPADRSDKGGELK